MSEIPRHQCIIYEGSPAQYLTTLADEIRERLKTNFRCLYLNSPPMVSGIRSYLSAAGIHVAEEVAKGSLMLSSDRGLDSDSEFEGETMLQLLEQTVNQALRDGYAGLWATGDMSWECGWQSDFTKLLEYEWGLEELFQRQPALCGVCQYHIDTLPEDVSRQALIAHKGIFVSQTLSRINPYYVTPESYVGHMPSLAELKEAVALIK